MANYVFWGLGASQISVSGGGSLGNSSQGEGTHLLGRTITLNSYGFEQISVRDGGSDDSFDDNDGNQVLDGAQSFDGIGYANRTVVEAEYRIVLRDPATGETYEALGVNIRNSSPAYATIEGLAFVDRFPPRGVALIVDRAFEGPGSSGQPAIVNTEIAAPPCFTPGTLIQTDRGARPVETLRRGDLVRTLDSGLQPLVWVGQTAYGPDALRRCPEARPVRIRAHAFGRGRPERDMRVSAQHRILLEGPRVELCFAETEVLAAAGHLVDGDRVLADRSVEGVVYIHLKCRRHEILISDGLPSESFNPGEQSLQALSATARAMLLSVCGKEPLRSARPLVRRSEARLWVSLSGDFSRAVRTRGFPLASRRALC